METSLYTRTYYNEILVYEAMNPTDLTKPPEGVRYLYPGGATLIDYVSNGDGTGIWQMYDEAGGVLLSMLKDDEALVIKLDRWRYFLPWRTPYLEPTITAYLEAIARKFRQEYDLFILEKKIKALPVPDCLQEELNKIDWEKIKTAGGGGEDLPADINGLLSADDELGAACAQRIWWEIECRGQLFEATFTTAIIIGRMLPVYKQTPVVEQRLLAFLYKVMTQPHLLMTGYDEMVAALAFLIPQLLLWARDGDATTARQAQYILIHVGNDLPEPEAVLLQEWQHLAHSPIRRGYTLFCLGFFYKLAWENEKMRAHFSRAFLTETDPLLRVILAIFLVEASKDNAVESWVTELITTLVKSDAVMDSLDNMQPFTGVEGVLEYLLTILDDTNPGQFSYLRYSRSVPMIRPPSGSCLGIGQGTRPRLPPFRQRGVCCKKPASGWL